MPWPAGITNGHHALKATYEAASCTLNLDKSDPIRLQHYEKQTKTIMLSTLQALAACENLPLPEHYIEDTANLIQKLAGLMATALSSSLKQDNASVVPSELILWEMFWPGRNINVSQAARALNIHHHTIKHYLQSYQIQEKEFSQLSDDELDVLVEEFKKKRPTTGLSYL
ncbi:hypothetical protein BDM02DRAFT_3193850 [Thelephora ganbajun]|uniref:Uncharacterized protein n=1 Tax=Thelephora ganbajun TaxID=370292 RepID=A0ACB6YXF8_THEGA|nr:hypothetical protein BDM02DRAFT_3193850 [Thelephora ganbajun]